MRSTPAAHAWRSRHMWPRLEIVYRNLYDNIPEVFNEMHIAHCPCTSPHLMRKRRKRKKNLNGIDLSLKTYTNNPYMIGCTQMCGGLTWIAVRAALVENCNCTSPSANQQALWTKTPFCGALFCKIFFQIRKNNYFEPF